jgi:hypothetical protein
MTGSVFFFRDIYIPVLFRLFQKTYKILHIPKDFVAKMELLSYLNKNILRRMTLRLHRQVQMRRMMWKTKEEMLQ